MFKPCASLLIALLCLFCLSRTASAAPDPDLVLHYTFDKDDGSQVLDQSSFGNNGEAFNTQYIDQLQGRRGVMRFNGLDAYVDCGDPESTRVKGDFSFSLWVRYHDEVKNAHSVIFGESTSSSFWFVLSQYNTLAMYYRYRHPVYGIERLALPVDRTIIGYDWAHITVVVEYPRCRFYRNGKLVEDAWMIIPGMGNASGSPRKFLGGDKGGHAAPIDVDELRLYRRALSRAEVAALAAGQELPTQQETELMLEPYWYKEELTFRFNGKNLGTPQGRVEFEINTAEQAEPYRQSVPVESADGTGGKRSVAALTLPLQKFVDQAGVVNAKLVAPDGKVMAVARKPFLLQKPDWVHTQEGYSDQVPEPWTPVKVSETEAGLQVSVWGRTYTFGSHPFLEQVQSAGAEMLQEPIALKLQLNAETAQWQHRSTELLSSDDQSAKIRQRFQAAMLDLEIIATLEYDGYIIYNTKVTARQSCEINQLLLQIPVKSEYAKLAYGDRVYPRPMNPPKPMGEFFSGAVTKDLAFKFSPNVWVADDERSLCWQAESDQFWNYAESSRAIEILPRQKITTIQANFINQTTAMPVGSSRQIDFALLATPSKPWKQNAMEYRLIRSEPWGEDLRLPDRQIDGKPEFQFLAEKGVRRMFFRTACIWPYPMPTGNEWFSQHLQRLLETAHQYDIKMHPYLFHQRYPVIVPEFEFNGTNMVKRPILIMKEGSKPRGTRRPGSLDIENGVQSQAVVFITFQSMAVQDSYLHSYAQRLDKYGDDGIYLDGTAHLPPGTNLEIGAGYLDQEGKLHPTFPTFAVRKFMQRLYIITKSRNPENIIDLHCSFSYNPSGQAYADVLWTGEQWHHLRGKGTDYIAAEFPLDMARTEFSGRQLGVPVQMIAYRLGSKMKVSASSLLLDTSVRADNRGMDQLLLNKDNTGEKNHTEVMFKVWDLRDKFDIKNSRPLFYYNNQDYVQAKPEKCYSTIFVHPKNGVLAFVTNLSPEEQNLKIKFNLAKLNLQPNLLQVDDLLNQRKLSADADGTVSITLKSEEWTYLQLHNSP